MIPPPVALTPGTRLGVYQIVAAIGDGGMGRVFRARDTKLDRDVAIKILPEAFAHDADRLARFTREAKTLASLNHPHIAADHPSRSEAGKHQGADRWNSSSNRCSIVSPGGWVGRYMTARSSVPSISRWVRTVERPALADTAMSGMFDLSHDTHLSKKPSQNAMGAPTARWSRS
jgi:serine/threonine protein kinase